MYAQCHRHESTRIERIECTQVYGGVDSMIEIPAIEITKDGAGDGDDQQQVRYQNVHKHTHKFSTKFNAHNENEHSVAYLKNL